MKRDADNAVSPVVGVMLMVVVVIIIATAVNAFAGGLVSKNMQSPQLSLDAHIVNTVTGHRVISRLKYPDSKILFRPIT